MRVGILARVSSEGQAEPDRLSIPAQLRAMRERCEREGWEVAAEFVAPGESAYTDDLAKRPVLAKAVAAAEAGQFELLMVHESSRLARNALLDLQIRRRLANRGVRIVDAISPLLPQTAETSFADTMKAGLNEYWSAKMSEHLRKVKAELFALGLHVGDPPFGYRRAGARVPLDVVPHEAAAIREAFRDYVAGATMTEIAAHLNAQRLRPRSKQGNATFAIPAVQTILQNDFYCGYIRHKGERHHGAHEAIIPEELWQAAQARVKRINGRQRNYRILSGLASCVACGGPVWISGHGRTGSSIYYYREPARERGRDCVNSKTMWRADAAEREVDAIVRSMRMGRDWLDRVARDARHTSQADEQARESLKSAKVRAGRAYAVGALAEVDFRSLIDTLDAQLAEVAEPPSELHLFGERLVNIGQVWDVMSTDERREACQVLFESVRLDTREGRLWVKPWPEFQPFFAARRRDAVCELGPPGGGVSLRPTPWLYVADDLDEVAS